MNVFLHISFAVLAFQMDSNLNSVDHSDIA